MSTIKKKSYVDVQIERVAAEAITPGYLIQLNSDDKVEVHDSAGQNALPMFAIEDALQGKEISEDYATGDQVRAWIPTRGDVVNAVLKDGENITLGDFLESAGDGTLQKHSADIDASAPGETTIYSNQIIGVALEDKNLSASSGAESSGITGAQRLQVIII